jgi:hypothetical protein
MSTSSEPRAVLVSPEDQGTIMAIIDLNQETMGSEATTHTFVQAQEVLMRIAQYSRPVRTFQAVCDHPSQMMALRKQLTDLQMK